LLFLASPWIADVSEMIAIHDPVKDFLCPLDSKNNALRELEQSHRLLVAEYATTRILAEASTMTEAISKVLRVIGETLGWEFGTFWLWDNEAIALHCECIWSEAPQRYNAFE